jgi:hypothetical protein
MGLGAGGGAPLVCAIAAMLLRSTARSTGAATIGWSTSTTQ